MTSDLNTLTEKPKRSRAKKSAKSKATTAKRVSVLGKLTNWLLGTTSRSALIIAADPESGLVIPLSPQVRLTPAPSRDVAPAREWGDTFWGVPDGVAPARELTQGVS